MSDPSAILQRVEAYIASYLPECIWPGKDADLALRLDLIALTTRLRVALRDTQRLDGMMRHENFPFMDCRRAAWDQYPGTQQYTLSPDAFRAAIDTALPSTPSESTSRG